jgi:transcriptional regulator with XRE-family HTH domain
MLPLATIKQIHLLLEQGELSQRQIAEMLEVSRGTVSAVASGRRGLYGTAADAKEVGLNFEGATVRCPSCGAQVFMPCLLCRAREMCAAHETNMAKLDKLAIIRRTKNPKRVA